MNKSFALDSSDAQEVRHKLAILRDESDLLDYYGLTEAQVGEILASIPTEGGEWTVPEWARKAVVGEMRDHSVILRDIADDARNANDIKESKRINRQSEKFKKMFLAV